jgi:lysophospholipase L1-like esterase
MEARSPHGASYYVALGDSISIDDYAGGPGRGGASLLARNRDDDFPDWQGRDLGDTPWQSLATDGATTATVLGVQLPRLARLTKPSIVTLTVGGNDVLGCYGDTGAALRTARTVGERVAETLERLAELAQPSTQVVVGTVYDPSDGTGDAGRVGLPPWPEVVDVLATLNRTLRSVAEDHGATVAEIHERFLGHGLTAGNPAQSDPRPTDSDLWYCNIIEPNAWGASAVRAAFWEALHPAPGSP